MQECEIISERLLFAGQKRTANEILNYSSTGELVMINHWFTVCAQAIEYERRHAAGESAAAIGADFAERDTRLRERDAAAWA